jgi:hypothetical protein
MPGARLGPAMRDTDTYDLQVCHATPPVASSRKTVISDIQFDARHHSMYLYGCNNTFIILLLPVLCVVLSRRLDSK